MSILGHELILIDTKKHSPLYMDCVSMSLFLKLSAWIYLRGILYPSVNWNTKFVARWLVNFRASVSPML